MKRKSDLLLLLVPVAPVLHFTHAADLLVFVAAAAAIVPLAGWIGHATEDLAIRMGPGPGGLLNATFGNLTELIIAVFLIMDDEFEVVKASITGSILGNLLLVLGLALLLGGLKRPEQRFNAESAGVHSASLTLAVVGLLMPALFVLTTHETNVFRREVVSAGVGVVLIALYGLALLFTFKTHAHLFYVPAEHDETPRWSKGTALGILVASAGLVAWMSEIMVGTMEPAVEALGISKLFVGLIVVPIVGNAAEHGAAVIFAMKNKMDVALEIAIGSSTQIALFIAPVLIFLSLALGHPMDFMFSAFEVASVGLAVLVVSIIARDGRSNWLEGAQLLGAYVIMAVSFYFLH